MTNRQTARVSDPPIVRTHSAPATIVRFPLVLSVRRNGADRRPRPSLALNVLLFVLLLLACAIWEAMSVRKETAEDVRYTPVTSPRAATLSDRCCVAA